MSSEVLRKQALQVDAEPRVTLIERQPAVRNGTTAEDYGTSLNPGMYYKPLQPVPDEEDRLLHQANSELVSFNQHIHELLPLLGFTKCMLQHISEEMVVGVVPLLETAMNQNGTHQAAMFYLVADWMVAAAMFAALPGVYYSGLHNRCHALPVQIWTKQGTVHHLAPGAGELRAVVHMAPERLIPITCGWLAPIYVQINGSSSC